MYIENIVNEIHDELKRNKVEFNIESICNHYNILIAYNEDINCIYYYKKSTIIFLKYADKTTLWNEFTHEFAHYALHESDQRFMQKMYNEKQEYQAEKFALLFQMPQHVIESEELFTQQLLMNFFNVDYNKALERLRHLYNVYCDDRGFTHGSI